jgi:long-chain fatty acid transport protein
VFVPERRAGADLPFLAFFVTTVLLCALTPTRSEAQALYYRSIPIGERAIGLGGAFTGVASDPSATYYNPAGMMSGGRFSLLGSFSSIVFIRVKVENAFESPPTDATFTSSRTTTLPRFIGTIVKLGKKRFGDHQFALGYSTLEAERNNLGVGVTSNEADGTVDLSLGNNYRSRWYGISFAAQVTEKIALGLTTFLADQNTNYSETFGLATGGMFDETTGVRVGGDSVTTRTSLNVQAYHIVLRLGWLQRINPRWQVGVMFQPPGIPLSQKGSALRRSTADIEPNESVFFLYENSDLKANAPIPFEIRAGFGWQANALTLLSVDAAVSGPVRDKDVFAEPAEIAAIPGELGIYFANSTARRWTPNVAVGAEHLFGKVVIAGGLFTNLSAAPDVPETATEYKPAQINMYGAAFSIGLDTKGYRLTFGATGLFGRGDALSFRLSNDGTVASYNRTKANRGALVLYIAGAVSVATKGAGEVQRKYKQRKERKKNGGEEEGDKGGDSAGGSDSVGDVSANGNATETGTENTSESQD